MSIESPSRRICNALVGIYDTKGSESTKIVSDSNCTTAEPVLSDDTITSIVQCEDGVESDNEVVINFGSSTPVAVIPDTPIALVFF